jgi:hypothetical protein
VAVGREGNKKVNAMGGHPHLGWQAGRGKPPNGQKELGLISACSTFALNRP